MKKDINWLKVEVQKRIDKLPSTYIGRYTEGSRDAYHLVLQDIDQLDDPEVLLAGEEPLYYAWVKGHELMDSGESYWHFDISNDGVFVSKLYSINDNFITKMSKAEWKKLGINDSNADFVEVEE